MPQLTTKELEIRQKCRNICFAMNKENATQAIEKEYSGCSVDIIMDYDYSGRHTQKQTSGSIMWQNYHVLF